MLSIVVVTMKCMFQNLKLYKVCQFSNLYKIEFVYSGLLLELELFQFDTILFVVVYRVEQILEIELSNFYPHQCQKLLTSCHNINITI